MSYIDRELLLIGVDGCISVLHVQAKGDLVQEGAIKLVEATRDYIASLSTADVVEVRHGYWIDHHSGGSFCSACKRWVPYSHHPKYCETCGARMDGKKNDHAVN